MAFPYSISVIDDFNRANGALGANWTAVAALAGACTISGNTAVSPSSTSGSYWSAQTFNDDSACYVGLAGKPSHAQLVGLIVRGVSLNSASVESFYQLVVIAQDAAPDIWRIDKIVSGSFTAGLAQSTQEVSVGDKIGFEAVGSSLAAYYDSGSGWTQIVTVTDSSIASGGELGIIADSGLAALDDFAAGNVVVASPLLTRSMMGVGV